MLRIKKKNRLPIILAVAATLVVVSYAVKDKRIKNDMTEYLNNKYSSTFEIKSVNHINIGNKVTGTAHREDNTRVKFTVMYDSKSKGYDDNYIERKFMGQVSDMLITELKRCWFNAGIKTVDAYVETTTGEQIDFEEDFYNIKEKYKGNLKIQIKMDIANNNIGEAIEAERMIRFIGEYCEEYYSEIEFNIRYYDTAYKNKRGTVVYSESPQNYSYDDIKASFRYVY